MLWGFNQVVCKNKIVMKCNRTYDLLEMKDATVKVKSMQIRFYFTQHCSHKMHLFSFERCDMKVKVTKSHSIKSNWKNTESCFHKLEHPCSMFKLYIKYTDNILSKNIKCFNSHVYNRMLNTLIKNTMLLQEDKCQVTHNACNSKHHLDRLGQLPLPCYIREYKISFILVYHYSYIQLTISSHFLKATYCLFEHFWS